MTGLGIVGCGSAAVSVAQAISALPAIRLNSVYDVNLNLATDLAERHGARVANTYDELLSDPSVEAVYIGVPHNLLHPFACKALNAGKHVLVEKPMALSLQQADELIGLAEGQHLALGVFYEMRQVAPFHMARVMLQNGAIGKITGVHVQTLIDKPMSYWQSGYTGRLDSPWRGQQARAGGGVILMNTSHLLDAVRYITGLEVERVSAETGTLVASVEVEDTAAVTLRYDNGAIGSIFAGAHIAGASPGGERFEIFGSQGQLRLPDPYESEGLQVFLWQAWEEIPAGKWHTLPAQKINVYLAALEEFNNALISGYSPPTSGQDARQVLAIILAIYRSAAEHRAIKISEVGMVE